MNSFKLDMMTVLFLLVLAGFTATVFWIPGQDVQPSLVGNTQAGNQLQGQVRSTVERGAEGIQPVNQVVQGGLPSAAL